MKQSQLRQLIRECINEINIEQPEEKVRGPKPIELKPINEKPPYAGNLPHLRNATYAQVRIKGIKPDKRIKWSYYTEYLPSVPGQNPGLYMFTYYTIIAELPGMGPETPGWAEIYEDLDSQFKSWPYRDKIIEMHWDEHEAHEFFIGVPEDIVKVYN